ncbi:MAG TPA: hypothetical protein VGK19_13950 [Capsulimonadaceae bacterium]|jgi:urea transporter
MLQTLRIAESVLVVGTVLLEYYNLKVAKITRSSNNTMGIGCLSMVMLVAISLSQCLSRHPSGRALEVAIGFTVTIIVTAATRIVLQVWELARLRKSHTPSRFVVAVQSYDNIKASSHDEH